ncbi:hypothetical protein CQ393_04930 [Stenotrophomonas sp. MYb238]|uniref:restriction endonuclease subunit S n=1 Tax=Stenotrophomonas sp. MYb238 TaxID=2040281 RepID=UPI001292A3CF|nr:restriction endonuclease subunit S [Stenotrophomonas sp. MYb238]MQP75241.1 hypothetical protein [Stenotrophomonas sp. MYb238]
MKNSDQKSIRLTTAHIHSLFSFPSEWAVRPLHEVLLEHGEKDDGNCEVHSVSVQKGIINQREHLGRSYATSDTGKYNLAHHHDVVYTKSPTGSFPFGIVKQNKTKKDVILSPLYGVFRPQSASIGLIVESFFESPSRSIKFLEPLAKKGAKNTIQISNSTFLSGKIPFPKTAEKQDCLAAFISSAEELISLESERLESLKEFKRALLQSLFPSKGLATPSLRFPEFRETAPWAKRPAAEIFSNRVDRGNSNLPIYSVTMTEGMVPRSSLDRKIDDLADSNGNKAVKKGDIVYNMMRMWQGALGVAPEDCMVSPAYVVLVPRDINPNFFYYLLKLPETMQVLTAHSRGLTEDRLRLYFDDFSKIQLHCPPIEEQNKIADSLMSLDEVLNVQSKKVQALRTHKESLLQSLFFVGTRTSE